MSISLRQTAHALPLVNQNRPLTNAEIDDNFITLYDGKVERTGDTLTGKLVLSASAAGGASTRLTPGVDPTTPLAGDVWFVSGSGVKYYDGATKLTLLTLSGTETLTNKTMSTGCVWAGTAVPVASGGTGSTTPIAARSALGLTIGTNVQAWDGDLDGFAGLPATAGFVVKTGANTYTIDTNTYATGVGSTGYTGSRGTTGFTGSGATGGSGFTGSQGVVGFTGSQGVQGVIGYTGSGYGTSANVQINSLGVGTPASGVAGEIRATNEVTAYYSSDARLKDNVVPLTSALDKLDQLRGVEFDWNAAHIASRGGEDGYFVRTHDVGVIAQEVQAVMPEVVAMREDGYLAVKYEKLVPLLIEAIKELRIEVAALKTQQ